MNPLKPSGYFMCTTFNTKDIRSAHRAYLWFVRFFE